MAILITRRSRGALDLAPLVAALERASAVATWGLTGLDVTGAAAQDWCDAVAAAPGGRTTVDAPELRRRLAGAGQVIEATLVALGDADAFLHGMGIVELVDGNRAGWALIVADGEWLTMVAGSEATAGQLAATLDEAGLELAEPGRAPASGDGSTSVVDASPLGELAVVRLRHDDARLGLRAGEIGAVVMAHGDQTYEVEFVNDDGSTRALGTFDREQLDVVDDAPPDGERVR